MRRQIREKSPGPQAFRIRRVLIAFLAAMYLVVGFAGEISCAEESLIQSTPISVSAATEKADEGSKKKPTVVEHCYTCAPVVMPALVPVVMPSAHSIKLTFWAPRLLVEDYPGLDTPPPKNV